MKILKKSPSSLLLVSTLSLSSMLLFSGCCNITPTKKEEAAYVYRDCPKLQHYNVTPIKDKTAKISYKVKVIADDSTGGQK